MEYRVATNEKPTLFNKDAGLGALVGCFIGPIGLVAGAAIGSYLGKRRMEKEFTQGRIVKEPTTLNAVFNKDTVTNGLVGYILGSFGGMVLGAIASFAFPPLGPFLILGGTLAGTAIGLVRGTANSKARMQREYAEAQSQGSMPPPVTRSQQQETAIAPEQQQEAPTKSFVATEEQRRQVEAAAQQQGAVR